jgi:hypothetical protein
VEADKKQRNKLYNERLAQNPRIWFGTYEYGNNSDPRTQSEDLGDNAMKASEYGIKNLKRIMANLGDWTKEEGDRYENLSQMYRQAVGQFNRYVGHVSRNIGGYYETQKSVEQDGSVFEVTPKATQKEAVAFMNNHLFTTPTWMLDPKILDKISSPTGDQLGSLQDNTLGSLLSSARLTRMTTSSKRFANNYDIVELFSDLKKGIFSELGSKKAIDGYRRNLQKSYVERMSALLGNAPAGGGITISFGGAVSAGPDPKKTDVTSVVRAHLTTLRSEIQATIPATTDTMSKYHLMDLSERIKTALDPK